MSASAFCWCHCGSCLGINPRDFQWVSKRTRRRHAAAELSTYQSNVGSLTGGPRGPPCGALSGAGPAASGLGGAGGYSGDEGEISPSPLGSGADSQQEIPPVDVLDASDDQSDQSSTDSSEEGGLETWANRSDEEDGSGPAADPLDDEDDPDDTQTNGVLIPASDSGARVGDFAMFAYIVPNSLSRDAIKKLLREPSVLISAKTPSELLAFVKQNVHIQ